MAHVSAHSEVEVNELLVDVFGVLPTEGYVLDFERGS